MSLPLVAALSLALAAPAFAQAAPGDPPMSITPLITPLSPDALGSVSPALERYQTDVLAGQLWRRPDLSPRDRSVATLAVLIARNQTIDLPGQVTLALDNGVTPAEISEIITHLAFYSGWANAMSAAAIVRPIFAARGVSAGQLPAARPPPLPLEPVAEARRAAGVQETVGPVSQGLVDYTGDLLFKDLWLRPDLAPRDRSLVTVSALIASGQVAQVTFHLNRAMDNGLTKAQAAELLTNLAFYAGWPNAMSAVPVVKAVFESRTPPPRVPVPPAPRPIDLPKTAPAKDTAMQLKRAGSQPSQKGPAEYFTGTVRIDPLHAASEPARVSAAYVTFEPGARSAWHTHPLGQILIVTAGAGWTQCEGEPIVEIRAGDTIWCPPGHKHWHGASPTTSMTHIAVQESLDGKAVVWMEKVTDEEYLAGPPQVAAD